MVYITPLHNPKTEHTFAKHLFAPLLYNTLTKTFYMRLSSRSLYALDLWIKDDVIHTYASSGVNVHLASKLAQEVKNKYEKRAQLKVTYTEFPHFIYSIDNFNYLLYNIMGENNNNIYIYISPLII